jgi:hypothetical protein
MVPGLWLKGVSIQGKLSCILYRAKIKKNWARIELNNATAMAGWLSIIWCLGVPPQ